MSVAIEIFGVKKAFRRRERESGAPWWRREWKDKVALHEMDLVIEAGGVTGILGPNGSGKSTLIRILGTLLTPDAGRATVFVWDVVEESLSVRRHVNRVSVEAAFFKELSPWENMLYAARLYGRGARGTRAKVVEILDRLGLPLDTLDQPMKQLSRGQQQKVAIARSFLTAPSLLLLDEPTTGLDPRSKKEVQRLLEMLRKEREVTVLLCTHDMDEAAALCDRVLMMDGGRVLADGTPDELIREHGGGDLNATPEDVFMHLTSKRPHVEGERNERRSSAWRAARTVRLRRTAAPRVQALLGVGGRLALLQPGQRPFDRVPGVGAGQPWRERTRLRPAPRAAVPAHRRAAVGLPLARVHGGGVRDRLGAMGRHHRVHVHGARAARHASLRHMPFRHRLRPRAYIGGAGRRDRDVRPRLLARRHPRRRRGARRVHGAAHRARHPDRCA